MPREGDGVTSALIAKCYSGLIQISLGATVISRNAEGIAGFERPTLVLESHALSITPPPPPNGS